MPIINNSKWSCLILLLLFIGGSAFAKNICSGDTGFMVAGSEAATIIKKAILQSCKNDPSKECIQKNTNAIDKVKEICSQCDIETSKEYCINAAETAASRALDELIQEKENQDRETASQARWDEAEQARIAEARAAAEIRAKKEADRPSCAPLCTEKDLLPPYERLPISNAELKGLRIRMSESEALKALNSKNIILSPYSPANSQIRIFVCGIHFKSPCDFSVAGERPFSAELSFYDGTLRGVLFVIGHPDDVNGKNKLGIEQRANWVVGSYKNILNAFVKKFGVPAQNKPHYSAPGASIEVKTYEHENIWFFGDDEIVINLSKHGEGSPPLNQQIDIDFFDKHWQIAERKKSNEEKTKKNQQRQDNDLRKRGKDL